MSKGSRILPLLPALLLLGPIGPPSAVAQEPDPPKLHITGMTFVGSRGSLREMVLRARTATFEPERRVAELEGVRAEVSEIEGGRSFSMSCDRATFNVDTQDFMAEGDVEGWTGDGRHYATPWVRYDHEEGVLYTDAPVRMEDETGSFRGDGFRYDVEQRRFRLLGNVRVEQRT